MIQNCLEPSECEHKYTRVGRYLSTESTAAIRAGKAVESVEVVLTHDCISCGEIVREINRRTEWDIIRIGWLRDAVKESDDRARWRAEQEGKDQAEAILVKRLSLDSFTNSRRSVSMDDEDEHEDTQIESGRRLTL